MIETILVATDGSETAADAEAFAIDLASRLRARLHGVVVLEDRYTRAHGGNDVGVPPPPQESIVAYLKARAETVSRRFSARARDGGVSATCDVVEGIADDCIVERGQAADLLVLGRDGEHARYRTALIGSTVDGVLRKTGRPSVVVPLGARRSGPLLLAFDGSPGSRIAARLSHELAGRLRETVHVFVDSKDKGRAVTRFEEARRRLQGLDLPVRESSSTLGRPDVKIVDAARESEAGIIVMGAFGRSRITEYFLGSNSAAVVRTSPVAVLLAH